MQQRQSEVERTTNVSRPICQAALAAFAVSNLYAVVQSLEALHSSDTRFRAAALTSLLVRLTVTATLAAYWSKVKLDDIKVSICVCLGFVAAYRSLDLYCAFDGAMTNNDSVSLQIVFGLVAVRVLGSSQRAISFYTLLVAASAIWSLLLPHHSQNLYSGTVLRRSGEFGSYASNVFVIAICVPQLLSNLYAFPRIKAALYICLVLTTLCLFTAYSRIGILASGMASIVVAIKMKAHHKAIIGVCLLAFLLTFFTSAIRSTGLQNARSISGSNYGHHILLQKGIAIFASNWLMGVGVGCLRIPVSWGSRSGYAGAFMQPGNLVLCWLAEMGVFGGLLFIILAITLLLLAYRTQSPAGAGLTGAWVAIAVLGLLDTPFGFAQQTAQNITLGYLVGATLLLPTSQRSGSLHFRSEASNAWNEPPV